MRNLGLSKKPVLFYNKGGAHTYLAMRLAEDFQKVMVYTPGKDKLYPDPADHYIGYGLPGLEVVHSFVDAKKEVAAAGGLFVFPFSGDGDLQAELRSEGLRVFGSGGVEKLEFNRPEFKRILASRGLPTSPHKIFTGIESLRRISREDPGWWVKVFGKDSTYRGLCETFYLDSYTKSVNKLDDLSVKLGFLRDVWEFMGEKPLPGCETGSDRMLCKGKPLSIGTWGYEIKNCYDGETEVLTDKGWKLFKDLDKTERMLTLNISDKRHYRMEYQLPERYVQYRHEGKMLHIDNQTVDLMVTPNHNLFVQVGEQNILNGASVAGKITCGPRKGDDIHFITGKKERRMVRADSLDLSKNFMMPHPTSARIQTGILNRQKVEIGGFKISKNTLAAFLGIYLSEGSVARNYVTVSQFKYVYQFEEILNKMPFKFKRIKMGFGCNSKPLADYLKQFGKSRDKFIPDFVKTCTGETLDIFLNAYCLGDGSFYGVGLRTRGKTNTRLKRAYYTLSKRMADDIQELLLLTGKCATILKQTNRGLYQVNENPCKKKHHVVVGQAKWVDYSDEVYCVTVPNSIIMVRRNGKAIWCGNSAYLARCTQVEKFPKMIREVNDKLAPVWAKYPIGFALSDEIRIVKKQPYCVDLTPRFGSPPGEIISRLYKNLAEMMWCCAGGEEVTPEPVAKYAASVNIKSPEAIHGSIPLDIKDRDMDKVLLKSACKIGSQVYNIPARPEDHDDELATAIGFGSDADEAMHECLCNAERIDAPGIWYPSDCFDEVEEVMEKAAKAGLEPL